MRAELGTSEDFTDVEGYCCTQSLHGKEGTSQESAESSSNPEMQPYWLRTSEANVFLLPRVHTPPSLELESLLFFHSSLEMSLSGGL